MPIRPHDPDYDGCLLTKTGYCVRCKSSGEIEDNEENCRLYFEWEEKRNKKRDKLTFTKIANTIVLVFLVIGILGLVTWGIGALLPIPNPVIRYLVAFGICMVMGGLFDKIKSEIN